MSLKQEKSYEPRWYLKGKPYQVQLEALRRSQGHDKYAYFAEQGLGKTALAINDYLENYSDRIFTIVVVCPNSFKLDWAAAPLEWGVNINGSYWPKDKPSRGFSYLPYLFAINFEAVRASGYEPIKQLLDTYPCMLVIDESSAIKNFRSQTARAVLDLAKRAKVVRLLNGTPLTQSVMDIFPQMKCVGALDRVNPYAFRNRYAKLGGFMGKQVVGVKNEEELHALLDKCSFRALKKDWSDLPEKIFTPVRLEMTKTQMKHYKEILQDFYTLVKDDEFSANMVLGQMDKLRQIASGILMDGDKVVYLVPPDKNPKIRAALEIYESGPGKVIIVHYYTAVGKMIFEEMEKKGLNPSYLRGGMKPDEITEQKRKFNDDPSCRVKVAQITAASKSHTLLGGSGDDRCYRMVFQDATFSLLDRLQMVDRIHRGVQDKTCLYYDLIVSPIDEAQIKALSTKTDIATRVVDAVRKMASY